MRNSEPDFRKIGWVLFTLMLWTTTSFLCHFTGKQYLLRIADLNTNPEKEQEWSFGRLFYAFQLTILQMAFCSALVQLKDPYSYHSNIARVCHVLASFATNISMSVMFASSTFAIKMMEPITSSIVQWVLLGNPLTPLSIASLPIIVAGAVIFTNDHQDLATLSLGSLTAFLSNVILAFRNMSIKQISKGQNTSLNFRLKSQDISVAFSFAFMALSIILYLETLGILYTRTTVAVMFGLASAFFHVAYSYVSTAIVLKQMSVVSHAVSNILKRVLVVLLLYSFGHRHASGYNLLGLLICTLGLAIYTCDKIKEDSLVFKHISIFLYRKSVLFAFLVACALTMIYVLFHHCDIKEKVVLHVKEVPVGKTGPSIFKSSFRHDGFLKPKAEELLPKEVNLLPSDLSAKLPDFLNQRIIKSPEYASFLSKKLNYTDDVIRESQRLHFNILGDALNKFKYAILFDIASFENKGDPCITVGEIYFLKRMNIELLYYCNFHACTEKNMEKAKLLAQKYGPEKLVILVHGGGNIVGYANNDLIRFKLLDKFPSFQMLVFPQSIWVRNMNSHVKRTMKYYCCTANLTLVLRDQTSFDIARKIYKGSSTLLMAPDMAFQIGRVQRVISPVFDILWLKRKDAETPGYNVVQKVPKHLRVHISDWWKWLTPAAGSNLEKAFYIATNGFFFLQRGRVIITDRLHGHILSTLMDIPHVLIDNKAKKLSSYHNTWTKSLQNTVITDDPSKALDLAIGLLEKFNDTLPPIVPYLYLNEEFASLPLGVPSIHYP